MGSGVLGDVVPDPCMPGPPFFWEVLGAPQTFQHAKTVFFVWETQSQTVPAGPADWGPAGTVISDWSSEALGSTSFLFLRFPIASEVAKHFGSTLSTFRWVARSAQVHRWCGEPLEGALFLWMTSGGRSDAHGARWARWHPMLVVFGFEVKEPFEQLLDPAFTPNEPQGFFCGLTLDRTSSLAIGPASASTEDRDFPPGPIQSNPTGPRAELPRLKDPIDPYIDYPSWVP